MGEVMVTVCRSQNLAGKMTAFLEGAMRELCPIIDAGPHLGESCADWDGWFWQEGTRIFSNYTHFRGIWRVTSMAMHRLAALKVGRRRMKFPEEMSAPFPVPYVRYGDYQNWPVFSPKDVEALEGEQDAYIKRISWTFVKDNGMSVDPGRHQMDIGIYNRSIFLQFQSLKPFNWDKLEEFYRPWCTEVTKPLDDFMTELERRW